MGDGKCFLNPRAPTKSMILSGVSSSFKAMVVQEYFNPKLNLKISLTLAILLKELFFWWRA